MTSFEASPPPHLLPRHVVRVRSTLQRIMLFIFSALLLSAFPRSLAPVAAHKLTAVRVAVRPQQTDELAGALAFSRSSTSSSAESPLKLLHAPQQLRILDGETVPRASASSVHPPPAVDRHKQHQSISIPAAVEDALLSLERPLRNLLRSKKTFPTWNDKALALAGLFADSMDFDSEFLHLQHYLSECHGGDPEKNQHQDQSTYRMDSRNPFLVSAPDWSAEEVQERRALLVALLRVLNAELDRGGMLSLSLQRGTDSTTTYWRTLMRQLLPGAVAFALRDFEHTLLAHFSSSDNSAGASNVEDVVVETTSTSESFPVKPDASTTSTASSVSGAAGGGAGGWNRTGGVVDGQQERDSDCSRTSRSSHDGVLFGDDDTTRKEVRGRTYNAGTMKRTTAPKTPLLLREGPQPVYAPHSEVEGAEDKDRKNRLTGTSSSRTATSVLRCLRTRFSTDEKDGTPDDALTRGHYVDLEANNLYSEDPSDYNVRRQTQCQKAAARSTTSTIKSSLCWPRLKLLNSCFPAEEVLLVADGYGRADGEDHEDGQPQELEQEQHVHDLQPLLLCPTAYNRKADVVLFVEFLRALCALKANSNADACWLEDLRGAIRNSKWEPSEELKKLINGGEVDDVLQ